MFDIRQPKGATGLLDGNYRFRCMGRCMVAFLHVFVVCAPLTASLNELQQTTDTLTRELEEVKRKLEQ